MDDLDNHFIEDEEALEKEAALQVKASKHYERDHKDLMLRNEVDELMHKENPQEDSD